MFTLTIQTDNAAFEDGTYEIARILRDVADSVEGQGSGEVASYVLDINGNRVGEWKLS